MTSLKSIRQCPKKAYYSTLGLKTDRPVTGYYEETICRILEDHHDFKVLQDYFLVRSELEMGVPENAFMMHTEREENLHRLALRITRMADIMVINGYKFLHNGCRYSYPYGNMILTGSYTFMAERNNIKYAVRTVFGKADVSMRRNTQKWIGKDPDLFVLYKVTGLQPAVFSLLGNETLSGDITEYTEEDLCNPKKIENRFWYTYDFSKDNSEAVAVLDELTAVPLGIDSEENHDACDLCWYRDLCRIEDTDNIVNELESFEFKDNTQKRAPVWTEAQKQLINARSGEIRVYAVAGSGKTSSLSQLVMNLRRDGISPEEITLTTFTEKGVAEIREKIQKRINEEGLDWKAEDFRILTLNGLGYLIVKMHCQNHGKPEPELIDESDRLMDLAKIVDSYPPVNGLNYCQPFLKMYTAEGAVQKISGFLSLIKRETGDRKVMPETVLSVLEKAESAKCLRNKEGTIPMRSCTMIACIFNDFIDFENEKNVIEYDDQIHRAVRLLKEDPYLLEKARKMCRCLIVDEFQDTGLDQMNLIEMLYTPAENHLLAVVGDRNQSIMKFRGVSNENIIRFNEIYPNAVTVEMNENFRSTRQICEVGETILKLNGENAVLQTDREGLPVRYIVSDTRDAGCLAAVQSVENWISQGVPLKDIAVICRTRSEILKIRSLLKKQGICNVVSVSEYLKDDNQVIAAINLAAYLNDHTRLRELAIWQRRSDRAAFDEAGDTLVYLLGKSVEINERFESLNDEEMYKGFMEMLHETFDTHLTNSMRTFFRIDEEKEFSFARVSDYLKKLAKSNSSLGAERDDTVYNAVTLTTVHAAKGREWSNVVVCANGFKAEKGYIENNNGLIRPRYDEEEVRTYFVSITRARDNLDVVADRYWMTAAMGCVEMTKEQAAQAGITVH